jgi:hypothetical protein
MSRIFLGNFDFEHELADPVAGDRPVPTPAKGTARRTTGKWTGSERFWAWLPIAGTDDCIVVPDRVDVRDFDGLAELGLPVPRRFMQEGEFDSLPGAELVPWGWTQSVVALGQLHGWKCAAPPLAVVREVNSRAFRFERERESGAGLAGAAIVDSIDELERVIRGHGSSRHGWLLKANFGMSGREAQRGRERVLDENLRNWAQKRFTTGPIVFEPMLERVAEAGIQFEIFQSGPPQLMGITPLLVDRSGVYRGSRFGCPPKEIAPWQPAVESAMRAAESAKSRGYLGPLGIDAMLFRDSAGDVRLRPLQDLNARYTMGRLALGFRRILPLGWCGTWLHFSRRHLAGREIASWLDALRRMLNDNVAIAVTSPRHIGSEEVEYHALVVLAATSDARLQAEPIILRSLGIKMLEFRL